MAIILSAFSELSTMRSRQMSQVATVVGPIPWKSMVEYSDRMGLDDAAGEFFQYAIRALDRRFLAIERRRLEKDLQPKK